MGTRLLKDEYRFRCTKYGIEVYNPAFLCIDFIGYLKGKEPFTERFLPGFIC